MPAGWRFHKSAAAECCRWQGHEAEVPADPRFRGHRSIQCAASRVAWLFEAAAAAAADLTRCGSGRDPLAAVQLARSGGARPHSSVDSSVPFLAGWSASRRPSCPLLMDGHT
jgi:hypothetical protein